MSKNGGLASPLDQRNQLRICQVRAVESTGSHIPGGEPITSALDVGRLTGFIEAAGNLAPLIVASSARPELKVIGERSGTQDVAWHRFRLQTAVGRLVDLRIMSTQWASLGDTIQLLEDLHYEALVGEPAEWDNNLAGDRGSDPSPVSPFHQLVFVPDNEPEPSWETIQRLIYRADLDAIEEHSSIGHPEEINRRPGQLAAVGAFGSVLWGIQDYVERSLVLSAALMVCSIACIQDTRLKAIGHLHRLRSLPGGSASSHTAQVDHGAGATPLTTSRQELSWLEADLTFGAEASATISPLLQSLRVESFHRALYTAADVLPQAQLVGQTLERLQNIVQAEVADN